MRRVVAVSSGAIIAALLALVGLRHFSGSDHSDSRPKVRAQLQVLAAKPESYKLDNGQLPAALETLTETGASGLGPYAKEREFLDPWGEKFYYRVNEEGSGFVLFTLGRDGRLGGSGNDQDMQVEFPAHES
jgi:general secretion pathway protein G